MLWWIWLLVIGYVLLSAFVIWQMGYWVRRGRTKGHLGKLKYVIPFISILCTFPIIGTFWPEGVIAAFFQKYGNIWVGVLGGFGIAMLIALVARIFIRNKSTKVSNIVLIAALIFTSVINGYGMYHAKQIVSRNYLLEMSSEGTSMVKCTELKGDDVVRIAFISDIHLGVNTSLNHIQSMVDTINAADVDLVIGGGDYFTSTYVGLTDAEICASVLAGIQSKKGGYYALGNHDVTERLFCGFAITPKEEAIRYPEMDAFFEAAGWKVKQDEILEIDGVQYVFRKDAEKTGDGINTRLSVDEIMSQLDMDKPIVVIEHEPDELKELEAAGADLVLSGHTHNCQIYPANIYGEISAAANDSNCYGAKSFGKMMSIVSSGVGYYGPPIRIGTDSEVVILDIRVR